MPQAIQETRRAESDDVSCNQISTCLLETTQSGGDVYVFRKREGTSVTTWSARRAHAAVNIRGESRDHGERMPFAEE